MIEIEHGTLEPVTPYSYRTDTGNEPTFHWRATSRYEPKSETFKTKGAAEFWLWLIGERILSIQRRTEYVLV